jgi:hypothetical protein
MTHVKSKLFVLGITAVSLAALWLPVAAEAMPRAM